jgi:hypothetical protein
MRTYFSPKGEREGGYHITVRAGGGGDPKGTGSLGGATTTPTAPRSIYRLHRPCCVVAYLSTNIPLPRHPPPPPPPLFAGLQAVLMTKGWRVGDGKLPPYSFSLCSYCPAKWWCGTQFGRKVGKMSTMKVGLVWDYT